MHIADLVSYRDSNKFGLQGNFSTYREMKKVGKKKKVSDKENRNIQKKAKKKKRSVCEIS
jgi:hypothetical protein